MENLLSIDIISLNFAGQIKMLNGPHLAPRPWLVLSRCD